MSERFFRGKFLKKLGKNETKTFEKTSVWNLFLFKFRRSSCCEKVKRTFVKPRCNFNRMNFFTQKKKLLSFFFKEPLHVTTLKKMFLKKNYFNLIRLLRKKLRRNPRRKGKKYVLLFFFSCFFFVCLFLQNVFRWAWGKSKTEKKRMLNWLLLFCLLWETYFFFHQSPNSLLGQKLKLKLEVICTI